MSGGREVVVLDVEEAVGHGGRQAGLEVEVTDSVLSEGPGKSIGKAAGVEVLSVQAVRLRLCRPTLLVELVNVRAQASRREAAAACRKDGRDEARSATPAEAQASSANPPENIGIRNRKTLAFYIE